MNIYIYKLNVAFWECRAYYYMRKLKRVSNHKIQICSTFFFVYYALTTFCLRALKSLFFSCVFFSPSPQPAKKRHSNVLWIVFWNERENNKKKCLFLYGTHEELTRERANTKEKEKHTKLFQNSFATLHSRSFGIFFCSRLCHFCWLLFLQKRTEKKFGIDVTRLFYSRKILGVQLYAKEKSVPIFGETLRNNWTDWKNCEELAQSSWNEEERNEIIKFHKRSWNL